MRVQLRPGATVERAITLLHELAANAYSEASPPSPAAEARENYVKWATNCEERLIGVFARSDATRIFENPRHRDVCSMPSGGQLLRLVNAEITAKVEQFRDIAAELEAAHARMTSATGCPAVLDSNVLLQCLRPDQVVWRSVVGDAARLMLPLRVVEELDAKKYGPNERLRGVARGVLSWLDSTLLGSGSSQVALGGQDGSTIELLLADRPRHRPSDPDEEVLDTVHEVRLLAGRVKLVTADKAMRLRAAAEGVDVCVVPAQYLRPVGLAADNSTA